MTVVDEKDSVMADSMNKLTVVDSPDEKSFPVHEKTDTFVVYATVSGNCERKQCIGTMYIIWFHLFSFVIHLSSPYVCVCVRACVRPCGRARV